MGDMADDFKALRKEAQVRRSRKRAEGASRLAREGVKFQSRNWGAHLVVEHPGRGLIDFWPGTGLWRARYKDHVQTQGRGVQNLINHLRRSSR